MATATCTRYSARQTFVVLDAISARHQSGRCDARLIDENCVTTSAQKDPASPPVREPVPLV